MVVKAVEGGYAVFSKEGKKLSKTYKTEEEAKKRLSQIEFFKNQRESMQLMWEAQESSVEVLESVHDKPKTAIIRGTALASETSRNGRFYTVESLQGNDGESFNVLVGHKNDFDNPDHNVGDGIYQFMESKLNFEAKIHNTAAHPDIIEQVQRGLVSVSIQAIAGKVIEKGKQVIVESLRIPLLALVNKHVRGVISANIESAIAEKMEMEEDLNEKIEGELKMEMEQQLKEAQEKLAQLEKENATFKEAEAKRIEAHKESVVSSILSMNSDFKKEELMEKAISELELIERYEKKIKEQEEQKEDENEESEEEESAEPAGEVSDEGEASEDAAAEALSGIEYDEKSGTVRMSEARYREFNESIKKKIYN